MAALMEVLIIARMRSSPWMCMSSTSLVARTADPSSGINFIPPGSSWEATVKISVKECSSFHYMTMLYTEAMTIRLIPFGWADIRKSRNGNEIVSCHHGEDECYGNQIQACMIKVVNNVKPSASSLCIKHVLLFYV